MSGLPRGWAEATFADISEIKLGKMLDQVKNKGQLRPYLRNVNVRWDQVALDDILQMRFTDEELEPFGIRDGDLLVCEGGEPGRCAVWQYGPTDLKFQKALMRLRPYGGVEAILLAKALRLMAQNGDLQRHFTGTTIKHLPQSALASIPLPLPPLAEQKRIVVKLDALNAKSARARIELARIQTLVSRYKQVVLSKAFSGHGLGVEVQAKLHLSEVVTLRTGPFGSALHKSDYIASGVPVVNPMHIVKGKIEVDLKTSVEIAKAEQLEEFRLKTGDVVLARRGEMGRAAVVGEAEDGYLCGTGSMIVRPSPKLSPIYLQRYLSSPAVVTALESAAVGTTMVNLNQSILLSQTIPLPSIEEQHEIVRSIESAFAKIDRLATEAKRALELVGKLDDAILAKAFRGELVPQDENDEPAEHLLARIRAERQAAPKGKRGRGRASTSEKTTQNRSASAMSKSRQDVEPNHLSRLLKSTGGKNPASELWLQSEMDIDEFYKQLRAEMDSGQIMEGQEKGELVLANEN